MDKQMAHKTNSCKDQYRKHCFASIDTPAEVHAPPSLKDAAFQCGLAAPPVDDPALQPTRKRSAPENPDASPENHSARQAKIPASGNPPDPDTSACIWKQFGDALKELDKEKNRTFARAAAETLKLSMAISQKILNAPPGINPEKTRSLVDNAWQNIEQEHVVHLKISPDDRKALKKAVPDAAGRNDQKPGYIFDEDPRLESGNVTAA